MKTFLLVFVSLLSLNAFAAPSQSEVDRKALETLLKKSGQFIDQENGESVASMLSTALVTSEDTSNKVTNSCTYDVNDDMFKCRLDILNYDDEVAIT